MEFKNENRKAITAETWFPSVSYLSPIIHRRCDIIVVEHYVFTLHRTIVLPGAPAGLRESQEPHSF
jgi:hypothetical protein